MVFDMKHVVMFLLLGFGFPAAASCSRLLQVETTASPVTCPLDLSVLETYTWIKDECAEGAARSPACCTAALSGMGLGLAKYLKETGSFELPDQATAEACLSELQLRIGLQDVDIVGTCFLNQPTPNNYSTANFLFNPLQCQGIRTGEDFRRIANATNSTSIYTSCKPKLYQEQCSLCVLDMWAAITSMTTVNSTAGLDCFDQVVVYVAGVINEYGPWDVNTANCIFAVPLKESAKTVSLFLPLGVAMAGLVALILSAVGYGVWQQHRKATAVHREFLARNNKMCSSLKWFKFGELKAATCNFSKETLLGVGSYGSVYKATFKDGTVLAVKQFRNCTPEGDMGFLNEVEALSVLKHKNLVTLQGCCIASSKSSGHQRLLLYDYLPNRSLEDYLFDPQSPSLSWLQRERIAIGMAQGLAYLHSGGKKKVIHRDIKTSNILLDKDLEARVADFGLAKLASEEEDSVGRTSHIRGTLGYVAPEYALYGQLTEKSDVYSFGVCLLELLSGRRALDPGFITEWAWEVVESGSIVDVVEECVRKGGKQSVCAMERFVVVGLMCAHVMVSVRPTMSEVLRMLQGHCEVPLEVALERPLMPLSSWKAFDLSGLAHYDALEVAESKSQSIAN